MSGTSAGRTSSEPSTFDTIGGCIVLLVLIAASWDVITALLAHVFTFFSVAWEVWLVLVVSFIAFRFLKSQETLLAEVSLKVLRPVRVGAVLLLTLELLFAAFKTFFNPSTVSQFESWLLDWRDRIETFDKWISPWLWILPIALVLLYLQRSDATVKWYLKLKSTVSFVSTVIITMTSFTFLSWRPLHALAEWEYIENARWYALSLRTEKEAVSKTLASRAIYHAVRHFDTSTKQSYQKFFYTVKGAMPTERDDILERTIFGPSAAEVAVREYLREQAVSDTRSLGPIDSENYDNFGIPREFREKPITVERAVDEIIRDSRNESEAFASVAKSASERTRQHEILKEQQSREGRLKSLADRYCELAAAAFSEAIGAYLFNESSLVKEYVEEVVENLSMRVFHRAVANWYPAGERLTKPYFISSIEESVPLEVTAPILIIHLTRVPTDPAKLQQYNERLHAEIEKKIMDEQKRMNGWRAEMNRISREEREERFER